MLNQAEFMREFNDSHREQFNSKLFERSNEDIVQAIYNVVKSCERNKYFTTQVLSFEPIYDYEDIYNALREHEQKTHKHSYKGNNNYDYINIKDTDMILIRVNWLIRHNGIERIEEDNMTKEVVNNQMVLEVLIAVPRIVKKYYLRLSGNYYTTTFQIVDGSTYNNSTASQSKVDTITMKTMFMPIRIFRSFNNSMVDIFTKQPLKPIEYHSIIFNNVVNAMYYILANYGLYGASQFLGIKEIYINNKKPDYNPDWICVEKHGLYLSCPKLYFQDPMVQSFLATIYDGITKDCTMDNIFDQRYWLRNLGMSFKNASIDKGLFVLDSIDGIYDDITKRDLHLPEEDKANIYCILRWLLREFSALRVKDNVDVRTKRIRIADYIAAIYANKLNKGMYRISDLGARVTLKKVKQAIYTQPMYIMNNISTMSNLVSYRDLVNDNDAVTALKYTYKGISGLGEDGASVQPVYRYVDPSHIGILDLDASSASDPGMSGMLCPMTNLEDDNSFTKYEEPNTWRENFSKLVKQFKGDAICPVTFDKNVNTDPSYMEQREKIVQEELDLNRIVCPVYNKYDPSILYTQSQQILEEESKEPTKSLFTIHEDNTHDNNDITTASFTNDDYDDEDDY